MCLSLSSLFVWSFVYLFVWLVVFVWAFHLAMAMAKLFIVLLAMVLMAAAMDDNDEPPWKGQRRTRVKTIRRTMLGCVLVPSVHVLHYLFVCLFVCLFVLVCCLTGHAEGEVRQEANRCFSPSRPELYFCICLHICCIICLTVGMRTRLSTSARRVVGVCLTGTWVLETMLRRVAAAAWSTGPLLIALLFVLVVCFYSCCCFVFLCYAGIR